MSQNRTYPTRTSNRFNNGQFVAAKTPSQRLQQQPASVPGYDPTNPAPYGPTVDPASNWPAGQDSKWTSEEPVKMTDVSDGSSETVKPLWMKTKEGGVVKKISNAERRRKRNQQLRRMLTPKNAMMVLNEMLSGDATNKIIVEANTNAMDTGPGNFIGSHQPFCASFSLEGNLYQGYGQNKASARNAAAEKVFRDLIIKKMKNAGMTTEEGDEHLPMMQLASFALHKLFEEWALEGHEVPACKPSGTIQPPLPDGVAPPKNPPKLKTELPKDYLSMHPTVLLNCMRPGLEFLDVGMEGEKPQNAMFSVAVTIEGQTFVGKAPSKKEARKSAAINALAALYNVQYPA